MIDVMENKILGPAIRQGLALGEARGEAKGMWRLLERQIERRFGLMPDWALGKLHSASPETCEDVGRDIRVGPSVFSL